MKKMISLILAGTLILGMTGCNSSKSSETTTSETTSTPTTTTEATTTTESTTEQTTEETTTETTWTDPVETDKIIVIETPYGQDPFFQCFLELHPDFGYEFQFVESDPMKFNGSGADIIYGVGESAGNTDWNWAKNTDELMPYEIIFEDLDSKLAEAGIPEAVTAYCRLNEESPLYGLNLASSVQVFTYRKSIAKKVFGTDDPAQIEEIIGGGSGNFDKFYEAAEKLKAEGYVITGRSVDVLYPLMRSCSTKWIDAESRSIEMTEGDYEIVKSVFDFSAKYTNDSMAYSDKPHDYNEIWYGENVFGFNGNMLDVSAVLQMIGKKAGFKKDLGFCEAPITTFASEGYPKCFVNKNTEHRKAIAEILNWLYFDCSETGFQTLMLKGDSRVTQGIPIATKVYENSDEDFRCMVMDNNNSTKWETVKDVKVYPWLASISKKAVPITYEGEQNYKDILWNATYSTLITIYGSTDAPEEEPIELFKTNLNETIMNQSI